MSNIRVSHERERGCGYRKGGGLYLVLPEFKGQPCGKLPLTLDRCPCCGAGIKFARGWTWIGGRETFAGKECTITDRVTKLTCVLENPPEKVGLIWIGEKFYKTPDDWLNEGRDMGVSRRIKAIPNGFKTGETWVCVAHVDAIPGAYVIDEKDQKQITCDHEANSKGTACKKCKAKKEKGKGAIFQAFKPSAIEYIVKGTETEEELTKLEERGISLVKVVKIEDKKEEKQTELPLTQGATA